MCHSTTCVHVIICCMFLSIWYGTTSLMVVTSHLRPNCCFVLHRHFCCAHCLRRFQGTTRLLLTKIPLFKEVIVSSFSCPHCGASNSSIQSGAAIEPKGVKCTFTVKDPEVNLLLALLYLSHVLVFGYTSLP